MRDDLSRRQFCQQVIASGMSLSLAASTQAQEPGSKKPFQVHQWQRDTRNPVFPPGTTFDKTACMNPFVLVRGDEYWLYYAGGDARSQKRICLATCHRDDLTTWKRHGPLFDLGSKGSFDETWCVLPCLHKFGDKWHLYYTGRSARTGVGLQGFYGMGVAVSDDLLNWKKLSDEPLMTGDGFKEFPNNVGIAGGGPIEELPQPDGKTLYRMHYTLPTGTPSKDLKVDQAKYSVVAHSYDGLKWFDKRVELGPRLEVPYENAATIALNVWKTKLGYRAIYAGIGTRFGAYSICEARSNDGVNWERGAPGENLALPPSGNGWEARMTEYPHVVRDGSKLRLFYCGNGYGSTGIGTAVAEPIEPL